MNVEFVLKGPMLFRESITFCHILRIFLIIKIFLRQVRNACNVHMEVYVQATLFYLDLTIGVTGIGVSLIFSNALQGTVALAVISHHARTTILVRVTEQVLCVEHVEMGSLLVFSLGNVSLTVSVEVISGSGYLQSL